DLCKVYCTICTEKEDLVERKMEKKQEEEKQQKTDKPTTTETQQEREGSLEGLPMKDSPYLQYKDVEEYNRKGYGAEGHLQPQTGRGAGATDAPTPSGASVPSEAEATSTDKWEHSGSASDQEEEEEALSLCDLPVNFIEEEINNNQEINNQSGKEEIDEETGTNQEEFNFGPFCGGGCVSTDSEMCAAEDVFFQGQILPLRLSVSSETGHYKFKQDTSLNPSRSVSRSESMDHNFFSSRSSSCRSHYSSSSTSTSNSNSIATPIRTTSSKPRVQNQFRYSLPSPKPQIRLSNASKGNAASNRTRSSSICSVGAAEPVPVNIVIMKDSNSPGNGNNEKAERGCSVDEKLLLELKMKKRMEQKQQGKQAMSRHRTFEWIKELSHASYLDHEEEKRAS
ncbi:hypothetical protein Tsubulata_001525, partial [Turnera subulata]